ncbi:OVARIAN TUMOR DOMAIN-containing deubiquitinating enzyme 7 [Sesamum angolense]|uniref:OVARIAN TUMOR DOMAIN-containing deubiquitinating enzyme 7 n=1 Tax=Sesamum angolense TaxID=2727404 RepID=A0AAE1XE22_9LAMI|nr:OVARIAN TUMOR DOMAIN-containing deubiquitinating enzyme 7 [Sesamum angolense]
MFEPFVEDEVPFDEYCRSMGEDGTWAGNMELQAASLVTRILIMMESIIIVCAQRKILVVVQLDQLLSREILTFQHPINEGAVVKSKQEGGGYAIQEESIKMIKLGSGCEDAKKIEQVLKEVGGDVDAAIEALVAEQGCVDQIVADDEFSDSVKVPYGNGRKSQKQGCPYGFAKKKYKSCCGSPSVGLPLPVPARRSSHDQCSSKRGLYAHRYIHKLSRTDDIWIAIISAINPHVYFIYAVSAGHIQGANYLLMVQFSQEKCLVGPESCYCLLRCMTNRRQHKPSKTILNRAIVPQPKWIFSMALPSTDKSGNEKTEDHISIPGHANIWFPTSPQPTCPFESDYLLFCMKSKYSLSRILRTVHNVKVYGPFQYPNS